MNKSMWQQDVSGVMAPVSNGSLVDYLFLRYSNRMRREVEQTDLNANESFHQPRVRLKSSNLSHSTGCLVLQILLMSIYIAQAK